jgi:glycosyltransferase 2 family protein
MPEEQSGSSRARHRALVVFKVAVSVILLAVLFSKIDGARLWATAKRASLPWLGAALGIYCVNVVASIWRWHTLLGAQEVEVPPRTLLGSFLVALFFNNFLPSNIGGDVIRIRDTARPAGSKTLATIVVLTDRVIGLMGLVLVAALGATMAAVAAGRGPAPIWPTWLWAGFLIGTALSAPVVLAPAGVGRILQPLTVFHPEWVGGRIEHVTAALARFRERPSALASCFGGAVFVQSATVVFYVAVASALQINITAWALAVIVPISFIVQMMPVSVNGFGVREATFSFYFTRLGLPIESALLVSLVGTVLIMVFSLSGAAVYVARGRS